MSGKKKSHSVFIGRLILLLLLFVFPSKQAFAVIYGDDDRMDIYEVTDSDLQGLADSVVMLMDSADVFCSNGSCSLLNLQSLADWYLSEDPIGSGNPICIDERFIDQPTAGFCSGMVVGPDLIATAGHCIENQSDCQSTVFVFNYHMLDASTPVTIFPEDDVYYGLEIVAHSEDETGVWSDDYAIVRVDRPIEGRQAVPIRRSGAVEDSGIGELLVIGHPTGLPTKIDDGGHVTGGTGLDTFYTSTDSFHGNSGSGVFSRDGLDGTRILLEGILVRGYHDHFETDPDGNCDKVIRCPDEGCPELETVVRATAFAEHIPSDYIVVFTDPNSKNDAVASASFPILHDYTLIPGFAAHLDYPQIQQLEANPNVEYIEPDLPIYLSELSTQSTPAAVAGEVIPDGVVQIGAPAVWPTTTGEGAVICVLDTGLELDHPDRPESIAPGWDFIKDDPDVTDDEGHGTHVAGTVGAAMGNGIGVAGTAPNITIMPLRFLGPDGGYTSDAIMGIEYAAANGAHAINMSWGTPDYSQSLEEAVNKAGAAGLLMIASAGDAGADVPHYPSAYDNDSIISVGASTPWGSRADFSNYGSSVDIVAPGVDVLSTTNGIDTYDHRSSTDMAVPHVTGTVALLATWKGSSMTAPQEIRKAMEQTAEDLGIPGRDDYYGHGLLNAEKALAYLMAGGIPSDCAQVHDFGYGYLSDLNNDCTVSLLDLELLAIEWLGSCDDSNQWCNRSDFAGSGNVSLPDFATFAAQWLSCNDPQELNCSPHIPNW